MGKKLAKPKDERTPERKLFDSAVRAMRKKIEAFAASVEDSEQRSKTFHDLLKASDRARHKFWRLSIEESAEVFGNPMRAAIIAAKEKADAAYLEFLHEQRARLTQQIKDAQPRPGTYEHELALMRGRK